MHKVWAFTLMNTKVLIMTDSPYVKTGMGIVHYNIGMELHKRGYEIISIGWSNSASSGVEVPWKVFRTNQGDYYGNSIFDQVVVNERPDIVITVGDPWTTNYVSRSHSRGLFQWVAYTAIDGEAYGGGIPPTWVPALNDADKVVTYTEYGKNAINKVMNLDIDIIPHGVDTKTFYPLEDNQIRQLKAKNGIPEDKVIYLLVARNQFRKNIPDIFKAWSIFTKDGKNQNAVLWPHMLFHDECGWNIEELLKIFNIENKVMFLRDFAFKKSNLEVIPDKDLNILYNMSDVVILISGEGFGLPIVEAMSCSKPLIVLNHSACGELVKGRGELVKVGYNFTGVHATERPYPDIDDLVDKFQRLYDNENLRRDYGKYGLEFSKTLTWELVGNKWDMLLKKVMNPFIGNCKLERIC